MRFGVETMPTSFLIDREGVVRRVHRGFRKSGRRTAARGDPEAGGGRDEASCRRVDAACWLLAIALLRSRSAAHAAAPACGRGSATSLARRDMAWDPDPLEAAAPQARPLQQGGRHGRRAAAAAAAAAATSDARGSDGGQMAGRTSADRARGAQRRRLARACRAAGVARRRSPPARSRCPASRAARPPTRRPSSYTADYRFSRYTEDDAARRARSRSAASSDRYEIDIHQFRLAAPITDRIELGLDVAHETMSGATPWYVRRPTPDRRSPLPGDDRRHASTTTRTDALAQGHATTSTAATPRSSTRRLDGERLPLRQRRHRGRAPLQREEHHALRRPRLLVRPDRADRRGRVPAAPTRRTSRASMLRRHLAGARSKTSRSRARSIPVRDGLPLRSLQARVRGRRPSAGRRGPTSATSSRG